MKKHNIVNFVIHQTALNGDPFRRRISKHTTLAEAKAAIPPKSGGDDYRITREEYVGTGATRGHVSTLSIA